MTTLSEAPSGHPSVPPGRAHKSVLQQFPGQQPSDATAEGWIDTLKKYCASSCTTSDDNPTFGAQTVQQIQSGAQVAAQHSSVNAIFPVYDYQMAYMLPELKAASAQNRINLLSENADLARMQEMMHGTSVKVDVGNPVAWDGWAAMDEALRALKGLPAVEDGQLPVRLFDTDNIKSINPTPSVLLLDEPTQGVDVGARRDIFNRIVTAAQAGTTVLYTTSETQDLAELCHRVLVFRDGVVCGELTGSDVTEDAISRMCWGGSVRLGPRVEA
jgi:hypothetical protein